ncbi:MAG: 50S ribosomal protein L9 [Peptococcaceae bacterium]|nr:50S ribosomal protein L9 [Peptococcaceae bacterium]
MKVVLLKDVSSLGKRGDVVQVAEGYARNFLLPRGLAQPATAGKMKEIARVKDMKAQKEAKIKAEAEKLAAKIRGQTVQVPVRVGEGGKLFGSVGTRDIAEALKKSLGVKIDRKKVELEDPIKSLGRFDVVARLYPGVQAEFAVEVVGRDS